VGFGFCLATGRRPGAEETRVLVNAYTRLRADFVAQPEEAAKLLNIAGTRQAPEGGASSPPDLTGGADKTAHSETTMAAADLAAAMSVASMLLSLDETITKN
jgi:hypothetical protein